MLDETVDGDLSNDALNPTPITLALGSNTVNGRVGISHDLVEGDIDFLTFTIEVGQQLGGLFLLSQSPSDRGFHGINSGNTGIVPSGPNAGDPTQFLGSGFQSISVPGGLLGDRQQQLGVQRI